jgi:fatty acid desaturase
VEPDVAVTGGVITTSRSEDETEGFRTLAMQVRDAGLLNRRPGYYGLKISLTVAVCGAGWAALLLVGDSWATLGVAVFLGLMFTQLGFVGHDAGHQQVFKSRRANGLLGLAVGNALIGVSFGWWVPKHSAHHAHPNEVGRDPDLGEGVVTYRTTSDTGLSRLLARAQVGLFFVLMVFRSLGLHVAGIRRLLRQRDRAAAAEAALIALHLALYATAVLLVLSPLKALAFVVVQQAVFSVYLGCSFAPNHKGMPVVDPDQEMSFVRRQVITARNVSGGRLMTFVLGGLNFQIEHHLFPSMPRPNLVRAQSIVRAFCLDNGLSYTEDSLTGSYRKTIRSLRLAPVKIAAAPSLV